MDFKKEFIFENDFITLSPLQLEHTEILLEISDDPDIWIFFLEKGNGIKNITRYVENAIANRNLQKEYPFIVFDKITNQYAGTTRFYEYSAELKTIKLGYTWYGKNFRGKGINKHCKYLLFEFAFEELKVERVGFGAYMDNTISIAALKSVGCQREGVLRNMFPAINGKGRADAILMSILREEWFTTVKTQLKAKISKL